MRVFTLGGIMALDQAKYDYSSFEVRTLGESREWSRATREVAVEPDLPIIDSHHHFYARNTGNYMIPELLEDINSGHDIRATVYVECGSNYRADGPVSERPVGETEFALRCARDAQRHGMARGRNVCAAIVGFVDLMLGDEARNALELHVEHGDGRFRGIRNRVTWDPHGIGMKNRTFTEGMLLDPRFRKGFRHLADLGLTYDGWQYHTQLAELHDLASSFPDVPITINHIGGRIGVGPYAAQQAEVSKVWKSQMQRLAELPNIFVKIGGLGIVVFGYGFPFQEQAPDSRDLAEAWRPSVEFCIETFGPARCMFESNFPADQQSCSYVALWNAFKIITAGMPPSERADLFHDTAARFYRLYAGGVDNSNT